MCVKVSFHQEYDVLKYHELPHRKGSDHQLADKD